MDRLGSVSGIPSLVSSSAIVPPLPPTSLSQSPLRPTSLAPMPGSISGIMGSITPDASPHPYATSSPVNNGQQLPKSTKKRKEGQSASAADYESSSSNRDVQSPAYSDISDDSNAVAETEILGKFSDNLNHLIKKEERRTGRRREYLKLYFRCAKIYLSLLKF